MRLTVEEFVAQEQLVGARFHQTRGVWWQEAKPFFFTALPLFRTLRPGEARPRWPAALAGYQHAVPDGVAANAMLGVMVLWNPMAYDLNGLSANTRSHVRRGLKRIDVRRIEDAEQLVDDGYAINLSALARQEWGGDRSHYTNARRWATGLNATFALPGREAWGAYADGRLVAYLRAYALEEDIYISSVMSRTDALPLYPNDALLHRFLESCRDRSGLRRVVFGLWCAKPSLNEYKQRFGFTVLSLRLYRRLNPVIRLLLHLSRYRHYLDAEENPAA